MVTTHLCSIGTSGVAADSKWIGSNSGRWTNESSWTNGIPNGVGAAAFFERDTFRPLNIAVPEEVTISRLVNGNGNMTSLTGFHVVTFESAPEQERVIEQTDHGELLLDVPVRSIGPLRVDTHSEGTVRFTKLPEPIAFEIDGGTVQFTLRKFEREGIQIDQLSGVADVKFNSNENEKRSHFGPVNLSGDLIFDQSNIDMNGPLIATGVVGHGGYGRDLALHADGNDLGHVKMGDGATITINGTTTARSMALPVHTNLIGNSNLTITEQIDLQAGTIDFSNGRLMANEVRKTTHQHAFIKSLGGDFQDQVMLESGHIEFQSAQALGNGRLTFVNSGTSIRIDTDDGPLHGTIDFNNNRVPNGSRRSSIEGEFAGSLLLGDIGSLFSSTRVEFSGPVSGGDLVISRQTHGSPSIQMRGNDVGHVGETIIQGNGERNSANLHLSDGARISKSSGIILEKGGQLSVQSREQEFDNVADSIPVVMRGGFLDVSGTSERFGAVHVESGFNRIASSSFGLAVGLNSLTIAPQAALQFTHRKDNAKIDIESLVDTDFLGGNVTIQSESNPRFGKYDLQRGVVGFEEADLQVGDPNTWAPSDHVGVRNASLDSDATVESLTLLFDHNEPTRLATGENTLNIRSGGLIGFSNAVLAGSGKLTAGGQDPQATLFVHLTDADNMRISANITDNPGADGRYDSSPEGPLNADNGEVSVVYAGDSEVDISGQNTYSGETIINGMYVRKERATAIPRDSHLTINGGVLENNIGLEAHYSASIRLSGGILQGTFETPLLTVESGSANEIIGSGDIVKTTRGHAQVVAPTFDGRVDVHDGTLVFAGNNTGTPAFSVQTRGTLESAGRLSGTIRLSGGRLASSFGNNPLTIPLGSHVVVANDSRIQSHGFNSSVDLEEVITIENGGNLSLLGPASVALNGIVLGDNASLKSESPLVLRGSVSVGQNTTIESTSGGTVDFELDGKLVATSENARLNFVGIQNTNDFFHRTIEVPANTSLAVTVDGTEPTLRIAGTNNLLKGGGRIQQSIALDAGVSILVGDDNTIGTLSVDGNLSLNTGSIVFDFLDATGEIGTGWDTIEVGEQLTLPESGTFRLVVQGAAERGNVLNFDPSHSASWQLISGAVSNPDAISRARMVTRGFDEPNLPRGGELLAFADESGISLQYRFVPGDFNSNGTIDAEDIDLLSKQIRDEVFDADFDLVKDNQLNALDHEFWVDSIANTYFGDANLDGEFNSSDFTLVFSAARYETGQADWTSGDWNGDGFFNSSDFVVAFKQGGYERGPRRTLAVPESTPWWLPFLASIAITGIYRRGHASSVYSLQANR